MALTLPQSKADASIERAKVIGYDFRPTPHRFPKLIDWDADPAVRKTAAALAAIEAGEPAIREELAASEVARAAAQAAFDDAEILRLTGEADAKAAAAAKKKLDAANERVARARAFSTRIGARLSGATAAHEQALANAKARRGDQADKAMAEAQARLEAHIDGIAEAIRDVTGYHDVARRLGRVHPESAPPMFDAIDRIRREITI